MYSSKIHYLVYVVVPYYVFFIFVYSEDLEH